MQTEWVRVDSEGLEVEKCPEALLFCIITQKSSSDKVTFLKRSVRIKCGSKKCRYWEKSILGRRNKCWAFEVRRVLGLWEALQRRCQCNRSKVLQREWITKAYYSIGRIYILMLYVKYCSCWNCDLYLLVHLRSDSFWLV